MNVLQSANATKPALLSVSNYLESWPKSIIILSTNEATTYESQATNNDLPTTKILEALHTLTFIAVFHQIGDIYIAPNYAFLYDRPTISTRSSQNPITNDDCIY